MGRQIHLEKTLKEILEESKLSQKDSTDREQIIQKLRALVDQSSLRGASLVPYGSFVSNLSTRWGDLDMSINIPMPDDRALHILRNLLYQDGWKNVQLISTARVPVLKFDHEAISCDVTVNNWSSQVKSEIFNMIGQMDVRFHDMVLLVKEWAQMKEINDSTNQTFNSYCLTLLVVYHLQTCEPPILPPLCQIYSKDVRVVLQGHPAKNHVMQQIVRECAKNIAIWRSKRPIRSINHSSLSELFISFMDKYCHLFGSDPKIDRICTSTKTWSYVERGDYRVSLIVVDPFEKSENAARTVVAGMNSRSKICKAFYSTNELLNNSSHQLSPDELLLKLSKHVSSVKSPHFINKSMWVPQQPGLRESTSRSTYPERLIYDFKDSKREVYAEEEAETSSSGSEAYAEEEAETSSSGSEAYAEEEAETSSSGSEAYAEEEAETSSSGSDAYAEEETETSSSEQTELDEDRTR